jgi:lysophospholipase L1-like esterase
VQPSPRRQRRTAFIGALSIVLSVGGWARAASTQGAVPVASVAKRCAELNRPIRIMPLGDSLTSGLHWATGNDDSYRPYLWHLLVDAGHDVDFVGTSTTGDGSYDGDHQGRGGFSMGPDNGFADADGVRRANLTYYIEQYRPEDNTANLGSGQDWVTWSRPDVVLLNIGTNDAEADALKVQRRLLALVKLIRSKAPKTVVVLSSISPNGYDRTVFAPVGTAARRIAAAATDGRVLYADIYARMQAGSPELGAAPFDTNDWTAPDDHVHMAASGGRKFAAAWYPTVVQALQIVRCGPVKRSSR